MEKIIYLFGGLSFGSIITLLLSFMGLWKKGKANNNGRNSNSANGDRGNSDNANSSRRGAGDTRELFELGRTIAKRNLEGAGRTIEKLSERGEGINGNNRTGI